MYKSYLLVNGKDTVAMGLQSAIWATLGVVVTFYFTAKQNAQIISAKDEIIASKEHEIREIIAGHERSLNVMRGIRRIRVRRRRRTDQPVRELKFTRTVEN